MKRALTLSLVPGFRWRRWRRATGLLSGGARGLVLLASDLAEHDVEPFGKGLCHGGA
jgi:hypothetical protein